MGDESVEELINKRDSYQEKANLFKKKRDQLHEKSKQMAIERDDINAKVRNIRNKIGEHKKRRDEYNERVKHAKNQRNELITENINLKKKIKDLEKERFSTSGLNINRLKQNLRKLETEQMTQPMSSQKEKKLLVNIKELSQRIKEQEESLNKDPRLRKAVDQEKLVKQKAEKQHDIVEKMAKKAQEEHQEMIDLLKQLDNFTKRTTEIQESIVMTKIEADKVHREFIDFVNNIHDLEKEISGLEKKKVVKRKIEDATETQKQADLIFERFKKGEKLSTDDLMVLQKAGLL